MALIQAYVRFLLNNPIRIISTIVISILVLFFASTWHRSLPEFDDPLLGFEARKTKISSRANTWRLLIDDSSASRNNLSFYPVKFDATSYSYKENKNLFIPLLETEASIERNPSSHPKSLIQNEFTQTISNESNVNSYNSTHQLARLNSIPDQTSNIYDGVSLDNRFCGRLTEGYAQFSVGLTHDGRNSKSLFDLAALKSICRLDSIIRLEETFASNNRFKEDCEWYFSKKTRKPTCCNSWSLPNYISCLNNKTSCTDINDHDLMNTKKLLQLCAPFYKLYRNEECFINNSDRINNLQSWSPPQCGPIPNECKLCDGWTYYVFHYLVDINFVSVKLEEESNKHASGIVQLSKPEIYSKKRYKPLKTTIGTLTTTNIFLPLAKSSSLLNYYQAISKLDLKTPYSEISAANLGLRYSLFEYMLQNDAKLFFIALILILVLISIYTSSLVISMAMLMIIGLSLCLSYMIYSDVMGIHIFPFINLLAIIISFGICSDNAMLFCKHWSKNSLGGTQVENPVNSDGIPKQQEMRFHRAFVEAIVSTSVATFATSVSFLVSAISRVVAVRCFCIFAMLSVLTNYLLIVLLLPPTLIIDQKLKDYINNLLKSNVKSKLAKRTNLIAQLMKDYGEKIHKQWIFGLVTNYKLILIYCGSFLILISIVAVFYYPQLQPDDNDSVQLLAKNHLFERYDRLVKRSFVFEAMKFGDISKTNDIQETLPIQVVFGVKPHDSGNFYDPYNRGSLNLDTKFNLADPKTQVWLLDFCEDLRSQPFILSPSPTDITNCFIETFKIWMENRPCRDPIQTEIDRSPCCKSSEFPYSESTFKKCIVEAINLISKTPQLYGSANAGPRFFKNSTEVAALIIEFQSSYHFSDSYLKMNQFFNTVNDWISWKIKSTAQPGMRSGWFISSNLDLLALQRELCQSTSLAIFYEIIFAAIALYFGTRNITLALIGSMTIGAIILITVAFLASLSWTLGVAESILITLTIGLSVDFALHITVAFKQSMQPIRQKTISIVLDMVGSPITLASFTTCTAGFVIVWSSILAYQQLGIFLLTIAVVSWLLSMLYLIPILATIGPKKNS